MAQARGSNGTQRAVDAMSHGGRRIDLREAYSIYYRRRWLAAMIVVVTLAGVVAGNYLQYPTFTSTVKILIERTGGPEIPFAREQIAFRKSEITETQCQMLVSEPVLAETVSRLRLHERPAPSGSLRDTAWAAWRWFTGLWGRLKEGGKRYVIEQVLNKTYTPPPPANPFVESVFDLAGRVTAEPVPSTDVILLTVRDRDPEMAARIADTITDAYLEREIDHQRDKAREVYELINSQIESFKPRYDEAEAAVEAFERKHQARLLKERISTQLDEISALEIAYRGAVEDRWSKVLGLRLELARTEKIYGADHPKVLAIRSELAGAKEALSAEGATRPADAPDRDPQADAMLARIREVRGELEHLTNLEGEYDRLLKHRDREEQLYSELRTKREEALMAESARIAGPRVFEDAIVASKPAYPRKRLNLVIGLLGGIFAAASVVGLLEFLDRSIRTPEQVRQASGIGRVWSVPDRRRPGALPRRWS